MQIVTKTGIDGATLYSAQFANGYKTVFYASEDMAYAAGRRREERQPHTIQVSFELPSEPVGSVVTEAEQIMWLRDMKRLRQSKISVENRNLSQAW
jgi:hypothetical protein